MISIETDLPFNGTRDYVHGSALMETFRAKVLELVGGSDTSPFTMDVFRINVPVRANGQMNVFLPEDAEAKRKAGLASVELSCRADGRAFFVGLYENDGSPIRHRRPANEKTLVGSVDLTAPLCGRVELKGIRSNDELFQAVIEANKQVHLKSLTGDPWSTAMSFRFAYCQAYSCAPAMGDGAGQVTIRSLGTRETGEHVFSLTHLDLEFGGVRSALKLCFASRDMMGIAPHS